MYFYLLRVFDFNNKLADLKTKAASQNTESAYALFSTINNGFSISGEFTGTEKNPEVSIERAITQEQTVVNCIGAMHCHLDPLPGQAPRTYKVFSFSDILGFAKIVSQSTNEQPDFGLYVTSGAGTFALKVNSKITFRNNLYRMTVTQDAYERAFNKYLTKENDLDTQILGLLNFMSSEFNGDIGLELYQQKPDGNWEKLELAPSGKTFNRISC
ncbi:hypothetical protein CHU92_01485 [Flavobacterium cyanobacteriorum]|uniref:Uncharacterized protein n=1 Tax=Flavobacterium cyanobacteriorum TaxID=2022802 RepID=A0A255ZZP3_9FLAO|nr:hypothetical protein [Flavobacterium cyanobacteriorum]OYQ46365.1 hypothetical protein CHU92_01485 [Flavobacterium cyanobacteriorum]